MYERILVPLDGSELAETIVPFAENIAGPLDAEVLLLRVVEPLAASAMAAAVVADPDMLFHSQLEAKQYLVRVADRLAAKGIRVRTRLGLGAPAEEIVAMATAEKADLITMTTHARGGLRRVLFGSVAEAVLRSARVPVLLFRMTADTPAPAGGAMR